MKRTTTTTEYHEEWVTTKSINDECANGFGKDLLDSPAFCADMSDGESVQLYTREQMLEMFRFGYSLFQKPYTFLHKMGVKDTALFPVEKWASVRSAASILKRQFGCVYRVERLVMSDNKSSIKVTRLS